MTQTKSIEPVPGTYAFTAMHMARLGVGAEEGFDWDAWKEEMKEGGK